MAEDLALLPGVATGTYDLADPISEATERLRNRFLVQFLSQEKADGRGSVFMSELLAGRVRTNSDVVGLFAVTASRIIDELRTLSEDIAPIRAQLDSFTFLGTNQRIQLNFTVVTELGTIQESVTVEGA